jgi:hypothetical protein
VESVGRSSGESVEDFPHPRRSFYRGARLAFWSLPSDELFGIPSHFTTHQIHSQPPSRPITAYKKKSTTNPPRRTTATDDRFRATPDPHRAHDHTMKYFQQTVDFDYSWEEVSTSNWQKYGPWNEKTPHVIAVDTLSRSMDPATGIVSSDSFTCQRPRFYHCPTATRCSTY